MASLPVVAIVGSPNMGKSTLFNRILRKRIAVVDDRAGVTRDRNYMETNWNGLSFTLIDTGGMVPESKDEMAQEINNQVAIAVNEADAVVYLVDGTNEPTDLDLEIARRFRRECSEKVILCANKCETPDAEMQRMVYWSLGLDEPMAISALHGNGIGDLLDEMVNRLNTLPRHNRDLPDFAVKLAIVGRPNAGKSSLVNRLLGDDRTIVSPMAGTTRDSIDTVFQYKGAPVKLIDTAGLRKKSRVKDDVEYYSNLRSLKSIYRADVCALLVDTDLTLSEQDMRVVTRVKNDRRGLVVIWNKWDIIEKDSRTFDTLVKDIRNKYPELKHVPMLSISALTGQRTHEVMNRVMEVKTNLGYRIPRADLEECFFELTRRHPHPFISGEKVRFVGIKQQQDNSPHFIVFCTNKHRVEESYVNYIRNKFYQFFPFDGTFVSFSFKEPGKRKGKPENLQTGSFGVQEFTV